MQKRFNVRQQPGNVFALKLPSEEFLFGRVIAVDLPSGRAPMPGSTLLYIYDVRSPTSSPDLAELTPERLLLPPQYTNRMLWTKGYAVTVARPELRSEDLLEQHCFWDVVRNRYVDEEGVTLTERHEPCGSWGLRSYRKIDDLISDALGIPRAPLTQEDAAQLRRFDQIP
jgi:hypothetical protein